MSISMTHCGESGVGVRVLITCPSLVVISNALCFHHFLHFVVSVIHFPIVFCQLFVLKVVTVRVSGFGCGRSLNHGLLQSRLFEEVVHSWHSPVEISYHTHGHKFRRDSFLSQEIGGCY